MNTFRELESLRPFECTRIRLNSPAMPFYTTPPCLTTLIISVHVLSVQSFTKIENMCNVFLKKDNIAHRYYVPVFFFVAGAAFFDADLKCL